MKQYQEALKRIMWLLEKLADWNGYDLSDLDEEYNYTEDEKALQELVDKVESLGESYQKIEAFITMCLCEGYISDYPDLEIALNNFRELLEEREEEE